MYDRMTSLIIYTIFGSCRLELQKKIPWFCVHEPNPDETSSIKSGNTTATE